MKKKKYIWGSILVIVSMILIVFGVIIVSAENTETGDTKTIENEKAIVRMAASISRGLDENDQVNKNTLVDELNKYVGNGITTVTESSNDILIVTFLSSGREYPIDINSGYIESTSPYLPSGFTYLAGTNLDKGLTIQDSLGNQYVWVEVPKTTKVYETSGLGITEFTDTEYENIEEDLHTYTSIYRDETTYADTYISDEATGLTSDEYYELKKKMLKSVYQNGGFYVGRYEVGTDTARVLSSRDTLPTPVIKANAYPYNYVTCSQAQSLASSMLSGEYTTSLLFGVQWDLVLKYLETKGATQEELMEDSSGWGNFYNSLWNITNINVKYAMLNTEDFSINEYLSAPYEKAESGAIVLTTGASNTFSKMGIYDFAGNVWEWVLEMSNISDNHLTIRGGSTNYTGNRTPARSHAPRVYTLITGNLGFRTALY